MRTKRSSRKSLTDQAAELVEQVGPHVEAARERIVNDYLPVAQSVLADARVAAQDAATNVEKSTRKSRRRAAKKARATAHDARSRARELVDAAVEAAPDNMPLVEKARSKPRRRKRFVLLLALVGAGVVVVKRLRGESAPGTSYTPPRPTPVPDPATASTSPQMPDEPSTNPLADAAADAMTDAGPGAVAGGERSDLPPADRGTDDAGGAFLDEVIADADEEPHKVTTPDQPAEVEDVTGTKSRKG